MQANTVWYLEWSPDIQMRFKNIYVSLFPYSWEKDKSWLDLLPLISLKFIEKYKCNTYFKLAIA